MLEKNKIHKLDALTGLKKLPDNSIDMVMTSPPYWGLRDYGENICSIWSGKKNCRHKWELNRPLKKSGENYPSTKGKDGIFIGKGKRCVKCGAWHGQLGLEPNIEMYMEHLFELFDEIRRVLKDTGTCWVNLGDTYAGTWGKSKKQQSKSLCLIPQRFSLGMVERCWLLRNTVIWHKPNCMPSSVRDRFTVDFEYLLFFSKKRTYYFLQQREPNKITSLKRDAARLRQNSGAIPGRNVASQCHPDGRNKRCVWNISVKQNRMGHYAVYPEEFCKIPIKAGCPKQVCTKCGTPKLVRTVYSNPNAFKIRVRDVKKGRIKGQAWRANAAEVKEYDEKNYCAKARRQVVLGCKCKASHEPGIVLDPFMGSGTTAVVAKRLGLDYIGFELSPDYIKIAEKRLKEVA